MTRYLLCLLPCLLALSGCDTRREVLDEQDIVLRLDWTHLRPGENPSDWMEFHLYDQAGNHLVRTGNRNGFVGLLPDGDYRVLVLNTDVENAAYQGLDDYATAQVCVLTADARRPPASRQTTAGQELLQPQRVYSAVVGSVRVRAGYGMQVEVAMIPQVRNLIVTPDLVGATERVVGCRVQVSNVANRIHLSTSTVFTTDRYTILSEELTVSGYQTTFQIFGHKADVETKLEVALEFDNGESEQTEMDITDAVKELNTPGAADVEVIPEIAVTTDKVGRLTIRLVGWTVGEASGEITQ